MSEQELGELLHFESSSLFSEFEKLVLRYAEAISHTPVDVPDELFEGLRERLTPGQLVELTSAIAWENYRARFNHAFGVEAAGYSEGTACALVAHARHSSVH